MTRFRQSAAQVLLGVTLLGGLTFVCFRFGVNLETTAFAYLILMVLLSLRGHFIPLVVLSIIAVGCLSYFFAPPIFDFRDEAPLDVAMVSAFWITSLVVTGLVRRVRRLAETAIASRKEIQQQAGLLDLTHDTVFVRDMHGVITYWNRGATELYGWQADEAIGKVTHRLLHTTLPAPIEVITERLLRAGRWEGELVHTKRDGTRVTVASRWALQRDEQGRPTAVLETNNDITERTRAEEDLRRSEERWKAVFENNPTMYFMVDPDGTILSVNPFGAEQLGYTVDELVGQPVLNVFHDADRAAVLGNVALCLEHLGRAMSWELRKVRKDRTVLWVRETAKAMLLENRPIVLVACEDMTERRRAEYLIGHVFESSPDTMAIVGRDYRYRRVNPVHERVWGLPRATIVGMHAAEVLGTEFFEQRAKPKLDRCFAGEDLAGGGWIHPHSGARYMATTFSPLRPDSERVEAALVIGRDITEYVLAEEALQRSQAELAHVTRVTTLGELAASIAHEVNQPLAAIVADANASLNWLATATPDSPIGITVRFASGAMGIRLRATTASRAPGPCGSGPVTERSICSAGLAPGVPPPSCVSSRTAAITTFPRVVTEPRRRRGATRRPDLRSR
jgi:PAS domain S-box-containing protein